jgi:hypothetical protein
VTDARTKLDPSGSGNEVAAPKHPRNERATLGSGSLSCCGGSSVQLKFPGGPVVAVEGVAVGLRSGCGMATISNWNEPRFAAAPLSFVSTILTVRGPAVAGQLDSITIVPGSQSMDIENGVCASAPPLVRRKPDTAAAVAIARETAMP